MTKPQNNKLQFSIQEDRAILMICIGIALIFWLLVKLSQEYFSEKEVVFNVTLPEDKVFTTHPPTDMIAEVEGTGWDLMFSYFSSRRIQLNYDLTNEEGLVLNRGQLRGDLLKNLGVNGLRITEVNYENLNLPLEDKLTLKVPIKFNADLNFTAGHDLQGKILLDPDSVTLSGPLSRLGGLTYWETDSLFLKDLKQTTYKVVSLQPPPLEYSINTDEVNVEIPVEQMTEKSVFVPLRVSNAPDSLRVFPESIKLTFLLGLSQFNEVSSNDFEVEVDLAGFEISEDKNTAPIILKRFPAYVKNVQYSPKSAEFFILKE
jgi:hypothetical protein